MINILSNKYVIYALVIVGVVVGSFIFIRTWENDIKKSALNDFNNKQLEQVIKDQNKFQVQLEQLNKSQQAIVDDMNIQNQSLVNKLNTVTTYLDSNQAKKDNRSSSTVLKNTIKKLENENIQ